MNEELNKKIAFLIHKCNCEIDTIDEELYQISEIIRSDPNISLQLLLERAQLVILPLFALCYISAANSSSISMSDKFSLLGLIGIFLELGIFNIHLKYKIENSEDSLFEYLLQNERRLYTTFLNYLEDQKLGSLREIRKSLMVVNKLQGLAQQYHYACDKTLLKSISFICSHERNSQIISTDDGEILFLKQLRDMYKEDNPSVFDFMFRKEKN